MSPSPSKERRKLRCANDLKPEDWLRFIQMPPFERCWKDLELSDDDLRVAEVAVMVSPTGPPVIQGTGGVRKIRFVGQHWAKGKRGAVRLYYLFLPNKGIVTWLFCHRKSDQETITEREKVAIRRLVSEIESWFD